MVLPYCEKNFPAHFQKGHSPCSTSVLQPVVLQAAHPDLHRLIIYPDKVTVNLFPETLVYTLYLLYEVKSLNDVKRSTLQFDSDTFQVGQLLDTERKVIMNSNC